MDEHLQHFLEFQETMYKGNYMIHVDDLVRMCLDFREYFDEELDEPCAWIESWIEGNGV